MQIVFDWIVYGLLQGIGNLTKKLFGIRPSVTGVSETWLGAGIALVAAGAVLYFVRR